MTDLTLDPVPRCVAFAGYSFLAAGAPGEVALAVKAALEADDRRSILVFDAQTSRPIDFDLRGDREAILARLSAGDAVDAAAHEDQRPPHQLPENQATPGARPGRPKLGVVSREVTLLPRHWDWLSSQPGGASVALRKLVESARRQAVEGDQQRQAREAAYRFMSALLGNEIGFEEASRALFAGDRDRFAAVIAAWPADPRRHLLDLAMRGFATAA